jgi:sugar phosphate isomerase/epimerase
MNTRAQPPLGLAHFTVLEVPPLELVRLAARTGFAFVGLRLHPAFPGAPFYELPTQSAAFRDMRRCLADEGVRVHDIEFVTVDAAFEPEGLQPIIEAAAGLGAQRLSVCGDDPDRSRLVARIAALCDLAAGFGMGVDLECMAWRQVASLPDAVRVMAATGRPNAGVLVDALHLSRTGGTPEDVRAAPRGLLRSAQLCDAPAAIPASRDDIIMEARSRRLPPGEGELPLRELLTALPPDAAISLEVPMATPEPAAERARRLHDAARRLFARGTVQ